MCLLSPGPAALECLSCRVRSPGPARPGPTLKARRGYGNTLVLSVRQPPLNVSSACSPSSLPTASPSRPVPSLSPFLDFDCSDPLGMESGEITSDQIMASSQYNPSWSPERSRLNYYENAWTPAEDSNKEWIQVLHSAPCRISMER